MTKITYTLIALIAVSATMTSVYALSDWRTACGINNPIDNLECAVDHIEAELNNAFSQISALDIRVTQNEADIADHELRIQVRENLVIVNGTDGQDGAQGPQGIQGEAGEDGIQGITVDARQTITEVQAGVQTFAIVTCDSDQFPISGGYDFFVNADGDSAKFMVVHSYFVDQITPQVFIEVENTDTVPHKVRMTAYCAEFTTTP